MDDVVIVIDAFISFIREYDWIIAAIFFSVVAGVLLYKFLFDYLAQGTPEKVVDSVRQIASLSDDEIEQLKKKNDPIVVTRLIEHAREVIYVWDNQSEFDDHRVRMAERAFGYLPERYEKIKGGGVFSQYDENKKLRRS